MIKKYVDKFKESAKHGQDGRYTSFDYCFNYFGKFKDNPKEIIDQKNLEVSCLQLGFYLASWGMYRGSSALLQHSSHFLKIFLQVIVKDEYKGLWELDIEEGYSDEDIKLMLTFYKETKQVLEKSDSYMQKDIETLVTKMMLGVFGCVPAYDRYFKDALKDMGYCQTFNATSLKQIKAFYNAHKLEIDNLHKETTTIDFLNGKQTSIKYTKAKIIDMYGFMKGLELNGSQELKQ